MLKQAWESFRNGDFGSAQELAEKTQSQAAFLAILQPTIIVLCLAVGIFLYHRRVKSSRGKIQAVRSLPQKRRNTSSAEKVERARRRLVKP